MTAHDTPMPGADYVHTPLRIGTEKRVRLPGQHIVLTMLSLSLEDTFKEPDTGWSDKQWLPDATIVAGIIYAWQYRRTDDDLSVSRLIEVPTNIRSEVKERVRAALA